MTVAGAALGRPPPAPADAGLEARAELRFERDADGRTTLVHQYCEYPHHVVKPLYLDPERPDLPTLCLQSVSGGLFAGDRLSLYVEIGEAARVRLVTQAATKIHRSDGDLAATRVDLRVAASGCVEYAADPLILFPDARAASSTRVRLAPGARAVVREAFLHHAPEDAAPGLFRLFESELIVSDADGEQRAVDRQRIADPQRRPELRETLRRFPAQGAVYALGAPFDGGFVGDLRAAVAPLDAWAGASLLPNGCGAYLRVLAPDGHALRTALDAAAEAAFQRGVK
ncbi:MAG: urease accessory protein UreD [Chloroflexi bacterium]|nr:urease accessory protein UreD [Chloroflexota bacterium]